ncbi:MAG: hypothetical protein LLF94_12800, partial [Chlamydiales bacterium]|nr:hypothetical protein [Chlamydiales bacterium]
FGYVDTLVEMGADISTFRQCLGGRQCRFASQSFPHSIVVKGATQLIGKTIEIPDLRAGFAYVMAALLAKEVSVITGLDYLDRGYENLAKKLTDIGAQVERAHIETKPKDDSLEPEQISADTPYVLAERW